MRISHTTSTSPHLVVAITAPISTVLLRGQLADAKSRGFEVTLLCSPGALADEMAEAEGVQLLTVPMERALSPRQDLKALRQLVIALRRLQPDIVNAGTPKAGLLVTLAAWLCRVPCRIYTMRGLRLDTTSGLLRYVLWATEYLSCRLAHRVICISPSLRESAVKLRLVGKNKATVLGKGSSNGLDVERFSPTPARRAEGRQIRTDLGIGKGDHLVIGFVGRLARDKGVIELVEAWQALHPEFPQVHLLLVGPEETTDLLPATILETLHRTPQIHAVGAVANPVSYYTAMDLMALPSYREGFGNVLLEAAAMEVPVVTTRIDGCRDAVQDETTGLLVAPRDSKALAASIRRYLVDAGLRRQHGNAGRARVLTDFRREVIWQALYEEYCKLLSQQGIPSPQSSHASTNETNVVKG